MAFFFFCKNETFFLTFFPSGLFALEIESIYNCSIALR